MRVHVTRSWVKFGLWALVVVGDVTSVRTGLSGSSASAKPWLLWPNKTSRTDIVARCLAHCGKGIIFFLPKVNGTEWSAHFEKAAAVPAREVLVLVCWFWEANRTLGASTRGRDMWFEAEY